MPKFLKHFRNTKERPLIATSSTTSLSKESDTDTLDAFIFSNNKTEGIVRNFFTCAGKLFHNYINQYGRKIAIQYPSVITRDNACMVNRWLVTHQTRLHRRRMLIDLLKLLFLTDNETQVLRKASTIEHSVMEDELFDEQLLNSLTGVLSTQAFFFPHLRGELTAKECKNIGKWIVNVLSDFTKWDSIRNTKKAKQLGASRLAWSNLPAVLKEKLPEKLYNRLYTYFKNSFETYDKALEPCDINKAEKQYHGYVRVKQLLSNYKRICTKQTYSDNEKKVLSTFEKNGVVAIHNDCIDYFFKFLNGLSDASKNDWQKQLSLFISGEANDIIEGYLSPKEFIDQHCQSREITLDEKKETDIIECFLNSGKLLISSDEKSGLDYVLKKYIFLDGRVNNKALYQCLSFYHRNDVLPKEVLSLKSVLKKDNCPEHNQIQLLLHANGVYYVQAGNRLSFEASSLTRLADHSMQIVSDKRTLKPSSSDIEMTSFEKSMVFVNQIKQGELPRPDGTTLRTDIGGLIKKHGIDDVEPQDVIKTMMEFGIVNPYYHLLDACLVVIDDWLSRLVRATSKNKEGNEEDLSVLKEQLEKLLNGRVELKGYQPIQRVIACQQLQNGYFNGREIEITSKILISLGWYFVEQAHYELFIDALDELMAYVNESYPYDAGFLPTQLKKWQKILLNNAELVLGSAHHFSVEELRARTAALKTAAKSPVLFQPVTFYVKELNYGQDIHCQIQTLLVKQGLAYLREDTWEIVKQIIDKCYKEESSSHLETHSWKISESEEGLSVSSDIGDCFDQDKFAKQINALLTGKEVAVLSDENLVSVKKAAYQISTFIHEKLLKVFLKQGVFVIEQNWIDKIKGDINDQRTATEEVIINLVEQGIADRNSALAKELNKKTFSGEKNQKSRSLRALPLSSLFPKPSSPKSPRILSSARAHSRKNSFKRTGSLFFSKKSPSSSPKEHDADSPNSSKKGA